MEFRDTTRNENNKKKETSSRFILTLPLQKCGKVLLLWITRIIKIIFKPNSFSKPVSLGFSPAMWHSL